ncbi:MAG TPA: TolC family protein [Chitinophagaceae bacterium]|nr:TolC family protein [Chitinophagaceae bacterium]
MKKIEIYFRKKRLLAIIGLSTLLLCFKATHGQQVVTLQQILDSIAVRNPGLQQFALKTEASNALGEAAKAWDPPLAGAGLSEFPYPFSDNKMGGAGQLGAREMVMVRLQQMFPNFSRQSKEDAYFHSFGPQNEDERATMQNMLFAQAKMAYYDALVAEKKLTLIGEQERQLQLLIEIAEGRLAFNKAVLPNIYKAKAKLSDLQSDSVKVSSMVDQAVSILNSLSDRPVDAPLMIDTSNSFQQKQIDILQVNSAYVQTHRTDILHTTDEIHSIQLNQEASSSLAKPQFGLSWDNMRMSSGMYMYTVMAMVTIPIAPWSSKGYKSEVGSMNYQIQSMKKMQDSQVLQALGNIRKDWLNLQAARKELQIFQDEVIPSYAKTYQANLNAFSENAGDIYETLMAWNDLTMKKMEYYDKLNDLLHIQVILETEMQQ